MVGGRRPIRVGIACLLAAMLAPLPTFAVQAATPPATRDMLVAPALRVSDMARSVRFYTEGFGLVVGRTMTRGTATEVILRFPGADGGTAVVLLHDGAPEKSPPIVAGNGYQRAIMKIADLPALVARLRAAGYEAGEPRGSDVGPRVLMVRDPDGYAYELVGGTPAAPAR